MYRARRLINNAIDTEAVSLDLSGCRLLKLPPEIGQLTSLEKLDLSGNHLRQLSPEISRLTSLRYLKLSGNSFNRLPPEIAQLHFLQHLYLFGNQLSELPSDIGQLASLEKLDLRNNRVSKLPSEIGRLTSLRELDLDSNGVSELPSEIGHLTSLQYLFLSRNYLSELPSEIGHLTSLKFLKLGDNSLQKLPPEIGHLTSLENFDLRKNKVNELPPEIGRLISLKKFHIGRNRLRELPPEIGHLTSLEEFDLGKNKVDELPPEIGQLTSLKKLYIDSNRLRELPPEIGHLTSLEELELYDNLLGPDLEAAYRQGLDGLMEYFRSLGEEIFVFESKLVLVGEGEVGKTSLLGALRDEKFVEKRSTTHGVETKPVLVRKNEPEPTITLNAWDFGGQGIYRATHQLFFTAPAVYLAVWKPRTGPEQGLVEEWIKLVKHRTLDKERPDLRPRVLVVATHGGPKDRQAHIDEENLRVQFGELLEGFHHVDNKTNFRVPELKKHIGQIAASLPGMGRKVGKSWSDLLEALNDLKANKAWIYYEDFQEICFGLEISPKLSKLYAYMLDELGHLVHYRSGVEPAAGDVMILKADWLSKAISFVLEDPNIANQNGLVLHSQLTQIWDDSERDPRERYPPALHEVFRRLMNRFELSYRVNRPQKNEPASLVAQLVPGARPENFHIIWPKILPVGRQEAVYICRVTDAQTGKSAKAEGLMYRLIVRLHRYSLGREDFTSSCHWQKGLLVDDDHNGQALIEEIDDDFRVTVRAALPNHFLHQIAKDIESMVHEFWPGLRCRLCVPCTTLGCQGVVYRQVLIKFSEAEQKYVPCSNCSELLPVQDMLTKGEIPPAPTLDAVLQATKQLLTGQEILSIQVASQAEAILSQVDYHHANMMSLLIDEGKEGPRLFSLLPKDPRFLDSPGWTFQKFKLTLWCEHSRLPLPVLNEDENSGVYNLELPKEWLRKTLPVLKTVTTTLSIVLPVAFSSYRLKIGEADYKEIAAELDMTQKSLKVGERALKWTGEGDDLHDLEHGKAIRAERATFRQLQVLLKEKDPSQSYGGLIRVRNKRKEIQWIHEQFLADDQYESF